jgi:putative membrane protein
MSRFSIGDFVYIAIVVSGLAIASFSLANGLASLLQTGPLTTHMIIHIALLNVGGLAAGLIASQSTGGFWRTRHIAMATALQIALLWGWHTPAAFAAAHEDHAVMTAMHISLFVSAAWFWTAVFGAAAGVRWMSIAAVLVTGKIFCLLAVLLAMSPRALYAMIHAGHADQTAALADQQLAALLMVVACPLTYVAAGVVLSARWLEEIEHTPAFDAATLVRRG